MFTGIVQGLGEVVKLERKTNFLTYVLRLPQDLSDNLQIGASVANNGCCLTITEIDGQNVRFDVMQESLERTNLCRLQLGDKVNVERAARFGDEIGGHVMSGHVMTRTEITRIDKRENNVTIYFALPAEFSKYLLPKGFIGLDGCSLTIGEVSEREFNVHLIPETLQKTLFGTRQVGDFINVEIDPQTQAIVDTVERVLQQQKS